MKQNSIATRLVHDKPMLVKTLRKMLDKASDTAEVLIATEDSPHAVFSVDLVCSDVDFYTLVSRRDSKV